MTQVQVRQGTTTAAVDYEDTDAQYNTYNITRRYSQTWSIHDNHLCCTTRHPSHTHPPPSHLGMTKESRESDQVVTLGDEGVHIQEVVNGANEWKLQVAAFHHTVGEDQRVLVLIAEAQEVRQDEGAVECDCHAQRILKHLKE